MGRWIDRYLLSMWPKNTRFWLGGTSWPGIATYERSAQGQLLKAGWIERQHFSYIIVNAC